MLLESKSGNWKHLPEKWIQLPKYDDDESTPMCIETSNHSILAIDDKEVKLVEKGESGCQKWTKSKAVDGYFALIPENDTRFLTVGDDLNLKIVGKGQISTYILCISALR